MPALGAVGRVPCRQSGLPHEAFNALGEQLRLFVGRKMAAAGDVIAASVVRAVKAARSLGGVPAWRDLPA